MDPRASDITVDEDGLDSPGKADRHTPFHEKASTKVQDYNSSRSNREGLADTGGDGDGDAGGDDGGGESADKGKPRKSGNESSAIGTLR